MKLVQQIGFPLKMFSLLLRRRFVTADHFRMGYNRVAVTYDDYWIPNAREHTLYMLDRLQIRENERALDLGCGTGFVTLELAERVGPQGHVYGIDISESMLEQARQKRDAQSIDNVELTRADITRGLPGSTEDTYDLATCCWALGYLQPALFLKSVYQRLKPGGRLGIIVHSDRSLAIAKDTFYQVVKEYSKDVDVIMKMNLPQNSTVLEKLFVSAGFSECSTWENKKQITFASGEEALEWLLKTGASAGFREAGNTEHLVDILKRFVEILENRALRDGRIVLEQIFVSGVAGKKEPSG